MKEDSDEDALVTFGYTQYAPADGQASWTLICGRSFIAGVAAGTSANVLDELWRLGRQEFASIESVVGSIPLTGESGVRSFAIVSIPADASGTDGRTVTAVVRGTACVDVVSIGGARRFSAAGVQPWVLADFRSVTGLVIGPENEPAALTARAPAASFPLGDGMVRASRAFWSQDQPEKLPVSESHGSDTDIAELEKTVVFRRGTVSLAEETPHDEVDFDETIIRHRLAAVDEDTILRDERPAPTVRPSVAAQPPLPAQAPVPAQHAVVTQHSSPVRQDPTPDQPTPTAVPTPSGAPTPPAAPALRTAAPSRFGFRIVPGDSYELDAPTFFGRSPRTPAIASGVAPRLVTVASPTQEVSSTHVRIEQSGDSVVVTDLRSTNGTVVSGPGIPSTRLRPGESRAVLPGTTVDIGDGNIIEIVSPRHEG